VIDDAMIIVDEAHNLDADCRDTASLALSLPALAAHLGKLAEFKTGLAAGIAQRGGTAARAAGKKASRPSPGSTDLDKCVRNAEDLTAFFERVESWMQGFVQAHRPAERTELRAAALAESLGAAAATPEQLGALRIKLTEMRAGLMELGLESNEVKSDAINESDNLLMRFDFLLRDGGVHYAGFFCHDKPEAGAAGAAGGGWGGGKGGKGRGEGGKGGKGGGACHRCGEPGHAARDCPSGGGGGPGPRDTAVLHLLCWSASVAFMPVAERASSVLLTSGTLKPMPLLQQEFFVAPRPQPEATEAPGELAPGGDAVAKVVGDAMVAQLKSDGGPPARSAEARAARRAFVEFSAPHFEAGLRRGPSGILPPHSRLYVYPL
jgi:Rad3-related DNA helicase